MFRVTKKIGKEEVFCGTNKDYISLGEDNIGIEYDYFENEFYFGDSGDYILEEIEVRHAICCDSCDFGSQLVFGESDMYCTKLKGRVRATDVCNLYR